MKVREPQELINLNANCKMKYNMSDSQRIELKSFQYKRMLEERRGHNYEYWNDEKHLKLIEKEGWQLQWFIDGNSKFQHTLFESEAKRKVEKLRNGGYYARIVCGYTKTVQREKHYSVIYKFKGND